MRLRRRTVTSEREEIDEDTRKWLTEEVDVPNPLAEAVGPDMQHFFPASKQARFFTLQCAHCFGVHTGRCPSVKTLKLYESGAIKEVVFHNEGDYDDASVIRFEDVFGAEEASGEST